MHAPLWRAVVSAGMAGLTVAVLVGGGRAEAHPGDPHESSEEHAAADLAGVPMSTIEGDTRVRARQIQQQTGSVPGRRVAVQDQRSSARESNPDANADSRAGERLAAAAATDPGTGGQWSRAVTTPVVPVFSAVLPNGKILMWDSVGEQAAEQSSDHSYTRAAVWDPASNTSRQVKLTGYNIFCAGFTQLADGRVLVAGGNKNSALDGILQTHTFDWRTERWSRGPDMRAERWYPSVAALGNGEALIVGGGPATAEVYQSTNALRSLPGLRSFAERVYPFLVPRPDGQTELVGPNDRMQTMRTTGAGALTATRDRDGISRGYGSFATFDVGRVLVAGGGSVTEDGQTSVPTKTAVIVDVRGGGTSVRSTTSMSTGRRLFDLTVLADGSVLATGGQSRTTDGLVNLDAPVFYAERFDPATETWTVLSSASRSRQYHAVASLLPDGRLLTGGGGICGECVREGYLERNVEYFSPPYLFKRDGSGELADRPEIDAAPATAGYAQQITLESGEAGAIEKVGLVRLGAPTHGDDQGQRYVPLTFDHASGSALQATTPASEDVAPPGYYMLFVTDEHGVPSVAKMIKLQSRQITTPRTAVPADYTGDGRTDMAVWQPSTGRWQVRGQSATLWGRSGDVAVPADYNGDGKADLAVWRPSTGKWWVRGQTSPTWGLSGDVAVPADYNGDGKTEIAVWRPSTGRWYPRGLTSRTYGVAGDKPVHSDYDGNGRAEFAVWRSVTGEWFVEGSAPVAYE